MEKAYDIMRWDFLKAVMGRFDFADKFMEMVVGCICKPSFAVFVNGSLTNRFQSTMGLQQCDPLSPYLFVLGAEVLTRLMKIEQGRGRLSGFPFGNGQGIVGHLLYVDDCLMVARATSMEEKLVGEVFKTIVQ